MSTATHLVYLVHCDPSLRARYVEACARLGITADVVPLVGPPLPNVAGGGLSVRYSVLAQQCKAGGKTVLSGLAKRYPPPKPLGDYEHVVVACYSAGYGLARELTDADRAAISGLVLIDSGHGAEGLHGEAIGWLVRWALPARRGEKVLVIGHTDVDPVTYASTTEVAEAAIARSGGDLAELDRGAEWGDPPGLKRRRRESGMVVEFYDLHAPAKARNEHMDALREWGDELVAQACALTRGIVSLFPTTSEAPKVAPVDDAPHGYRCSVAEQVWDAKDNDTWVPCEDVLLGRYVVKPGDAIVSSRLGEEPEQGGRGHVESVEQVHDIMRPVTIGANESNTWVRDVYDLRQKDFRGVIRCPDRLRTKVVEVLVGELGTTPKIAEVPGPKAHPRIQQYHAGARRRGGPRAGMPGREGEGSSPLGERASDEVAWCASARSWCVREAVRQLDTGVLP